MAGSTSIVRQIESADCAAIVEIYTYYVTKTIVSFEEEPIGVGEMVCRIDDVRSSSLPWLVAEQRGRFLATHIRHLGGHGIGSALYAQLFLLVQERGTHSVIGGIALPYDPSIALHEKFGLKGVAHFEQVGFKFNRWIDVGYWQRTLSKPLHDP